MKTLLIVFLLFSYHGISSCQVESPPSPTSRNLTLDYEYSEPEEHLFQTTLSLKGAKFLNGMNSLPLSVQFRAIRGDLNLQQSGAEVGIPMRSVQFEQAPTIRIEEGKVWNAMMVRRIRPKIAKPAFCETELTTVHLDIPNRDPNAFYYPSCVRVERCNGCCSHDLLSCQAKVTEVVNTTIMKADQRTNQIEYLNVPVVQHKSCSCGCIVKKEDCSSNQVYKESDCRCACRASEMDKIECIYNPNRIWNPHSCFCQCLRIYECTTGQFFNTKSCNCEDQRKLDE